MVDRRTFLKASVGAAAATLASCRGRDEIRWNHDAVTKAAQSAVAIVGAERYGPGLEDVVRRGLALCGVAVRGRRVVVKPNMVELDPHGVINTHPSLVGAVIETVRSLGAREVVVAEGPGHRRDTEYLVDTSGLVDVLQQTRTPYVDLNVDRVRAVPARSHYTTLGQLYLPETVLEADLLISMPKMKTHHWAGVTLSMKNLFGLMPGAVYGWPKNLLHWEGIENSILDINAALPVRRFNIVDGIVGMEGNGPIQGEAKPVGVVVFGEDPVAVDATCARLMRVDPGRVRYLAEAMRFLGNGELERVVQHGDAIEPHARDFAVVESFRHIKAA